jgi:RimJ/RimL family protein N-acetyltransferase/nitroimidazol reductase NimA-like FMN-containing flavoprotein (pyridoxamine 5'-phosphate oxidase superfamily)
MPDRTIPHRYPDRMRRDDATVHDILDEALHCHLAFVAGDGQPRVLPTLHVRLGDTLYVHGSTGSHPMLAARGGGLPVSVAVTLVDGLALARSQFHHSVNYRSVVVHGTATPLADPTAKRAVLAALVDKIAEGRAADTRPPTDKELAQTSVLAVPLAEAAAKVRDAGINEEPADLALPHWAGVLPLRLAAGEPQPDVPGLVLPEYLLDWHRGARPERSPWHTPAVLTGARVRLEPLSPAHVDDLWAIAEPEIYTWQGTQPASRDEMAHHVTTAVRAGVTGERVAWAQIDLASGRAVGTTSYYDIDPVHRRVEIGYTWLGRRWWRTGFNREAKLLLMTRAFDELGARRVSWRTDLRNERSQRAIEGLGATREGVFRNHMIRPDGTQRDTVYYSVTAEEWPAVRDRLAAGLAARSA